MTSSITRPSAGELHLSGLSTEEFAALQELVNILYDVQNRLTPAADLMRRNLSALLIASGAGK